jgi:hypothetical protein
MPRLLARLLRRRAVVRDVSTRALARSMAFPCPHCAMLLGRVAQRRRRCPRCLQPVAAATRHPE